MWTFRAIALFFSLLLLSESTAATVGNHGLKIAQQSAPTPSVPLRAEKKQLYQQAVQLVKEARELEKKGTREGYQQAIAKYQQVLKITQELGLRKEEFDILASIAKVYSDTHDNKNAINYLKQALEISRQLKQPVWEATALGSIGVLYINTNNPTEGLIYLQKAQSIFLAYKEYSSLATTLNGIATIHLRVGDTKEALNYRNEALKIYREKLKDLLGEANTLRDIASIYYLSGEPRTATNYYAQALKIQRQRKDYPSQVEILTKIAVLQGELSNIKKALESLKEALKIQQQVGFNLSDQANTIAYIGHNYAKQADYRTAIDYYQQAGKLFQQAGNTAMESRTFAMIANVHKTFSGDYPKALELLDKALKLQVNDKDAQAFTLGQKADIYVSQANYQLALDEYNKALDLQRSIPNPRAEARTLSSIALIYRHLGDYKSSFYTYNKVLDIYKHTPNKSEEIRILGLIATVYVMQDKYEEALQSYNQALSLLSSDNYQTEIQIIWGITETYLSLNNYPKALEYANRAVKLSQKNSFSEEFSLYTLATVYRAKGDYQKSLEISNEILAYYRKAGLRILEARMLGDMSITYDLQKKYQQAIDTLNQELKLQRELKDNKAEANALYAIAINQRKLGNLEAALPNIKAAIDIVENIRSSVKDKELRTSYFATIQGYYKFYINLLMELYKKDSSKVCEFTTKDITIKDKCNAIAFHMSERSRARGLLELLTEANAKIRKDANPELLSEESRLQALIDGKEKVRFEIVNSDKINTPTFKANAEKLQAEIDVLLSQQKELETKIRSSNPKYASLKYPQPLTLPQIQQQLDKDTLLLQYSLGIERSYVWVVSSNSLDTYELPQKQQIEKSAINLFCLISQNSSKPPSATDTKNACDRVTVRRIDVAAKELSELILTRVKDKLGKKRLVIVADSALQYIPFAALADLKNSHSTSVQEKGEKEKQKDTSCNNGGGIRVCPNNDSPQNKFDYEPLFVNHEIVNLPSASTIAIQRKELATRPSARKTLAILADPVYNATDERVSNAQNKQLVQQESLGLELERSALKRSADIINRQGWKRLSGTRSEAETILKLLKLLPDSKSLQVFDFDANYDWATSNALNQFGILHFATHGFVNDANPELSGIVLSLVDQQGKDIRGYLRLGDLFNLDYPADLIVLSACETGLGKEIQGEGLVGLTRGLMYAGAERLVVSLWQVSDEGTSVFMQEFYQQMWQEGKSASAALRATQLKMWRSEKWRNPNYWAAFTFLGEWR